MCCAATRITKGLVYWERIYMDDETLGDRMFIRKKDKKYRGGEKLTVQSALIGIAAFLLIYGVTSLDPGNDAWIMAGYDEGDIVQHYSGWLAYKNSPWKFPLGLADQMAVGTGSIISYTDSIPWVAIFFKLFRIFLPDGFQYFGIYTLACYMLQAIAAFKILFYQTRNKSYSMFGTVLFAFAPVFMERAFRHTALASQWLILFSIYLYVKHKKDPGKRTYIYFLLLEALAIGIHPYFLPMVFCFSLLCTYEDLRNKKRVSVCIFAGQVGVTYLIGCLLGALGSGIDVSRWGFGYFSMNLNAVINPTSCGGYNWSSIFKVHPQTLGNYDGFNYLGAGIVVLSFVIILLTMVFHTGREIADAVKRNAALFFVLCCCTVFAVSNVVTCGGRVLFTCPLPDWILKVCGIFRASSRMFYPVYYLLFIFLLLQLWKWKEKIGKVSVMRLVLLIVCIQLMDIRYAVCQKHQQMKNHTAYASILQDQELIKAAKEGEYLILDQCREGFERQLAVWAHRNRLKTYFTTANSGDFSECLARREEAVQRIFDTQDLGSNIIATADKAAVLRYMSLPDAALYTYDGIYFIYKNVGERVYTREKQVYELDGQVIDFAKTNVMLCNLSDENWEYGVKKDGYTLLFSYSKELLDTLQSVKQIICQGESFAITGFDYDAYYIRVTVSTDAKKCKYPQVLQLV